MISILSHNKLNEQKNNLYITYPRTVNIIFGHYDYPDINQIKKYGKITAIKPHSCTPAPKLFGIKREFRHTNGKLSVSLNKDQTQSMFDSSNLTKIMSTMKLM